MSEALDWDRELLRGILDNQEGFLASVSFDTSYDLLRKYLENQAGIRQYHPLDEIRDLLAKVVMNAGGTVSPLDDIWNLVLAWLKTFGPLPNCCIGAYNVNDLLRMIAEGSSPVNLGLQYELQFEL